MTSTAKMAAADELLPLLGKRAVRLMPDADGSALGGDLDLAVLELDHLWPLRLDKEWRLCQCLRYDLTGWYWILEHSGDVLAIDTMDDTHGIGLYGFPTSLLSARATDSAVQAAYLTSKRVRKAAGWATVYESSRPFVAEWRRIRDIALRDEPGYRHALEVTFGRQLASELAAASLAGTPPTPRLLRRARIALLARRFRSPTRFAVGLREGTSRWMRRMVAPTGLVVAIVGPDGSGKSTLAENLTTASRGLFRRDVHLHWRPGVLPRPGEIIRSPQPDASTPHSRPSHGRALSNLLVTYYWFDFLIGGWAKLWPMKVRSTLVLVERGWEDIAVDPRRYRLDVSASLVRSLGRLLPRPDLILVLEAQPEVIAGRKTELTKEESSRQVLEWRNRLADDLATTFLDADQPSQDVLRQARESILRYLEARAVARLGAGWANLPRGDARWWIPRSPRKTVRAGLRIHQPMTTNGRVVWEAARFVANLGGFSAIPRGPAPPRSVREVLAPFVPARGTFAIGRANHEQRFYGLIINRDGRCVAVAKIATGVEGRLSLGKEAENLTEVASLLPLPLHAPTLLEKTDDVLLLEPVEWSPRQRPWELPEGVAHALGRFFRAGSLEDRLAGLCHGDFAPWNLLRTASSYTLVDWEEASTSSPPFFDVLHYLVQSHALLGRPSESELLLAVSGSGRAGAHLVAYADGAHIDLDIAAVSMREYLERSQAALDPTTPDGRKGIKARQRLLESLS